MDKFIAFLILGFTVVIALLIYLIVQAHGAAAPTCWPVSSANFDGAKFKARYKLTNDDFRYSSDSVCVRAGITLPDNPPIFEASDSPEVAARKREMTRIDQEKVLRAILLIILSEFNLHANKINSILDAVDASTSLADLKTRIAAIQDYPQRTQTQLINSIKNAIDAGDAD